MGTAPIAHPITAIDTVAGIMVTVISVAASEGATAAPQERPIGTRHKALDNADVLYLLFCAGMV